MSYLDCPSLIIGGMPDHVHLMFVLARTMSISKTMEELKKESSKWAKLHIHRHFYWQNGYGAFSVSPSNTENVRKYIANQEEHHQLRSFQDEFRELLHRHEMEWDEQYIWD